MIHFKPATIEDALRVANNIRPEDKAEVEGMGANLLHLPYSALTSKHCSTFWHDDVLGGIAGVVEYDNDGTGYVWMLCTPAVETRPHIVARNARRWINGLSKHYKLLYSLADTRNAVHHRLLKFLGFKALRVVPVGPNQLPYYEIVKLCA